MAGKPSSSSLTSTLNDWDAASLANYRIHSDFSLKGTYTYYDGVDSVVSHFQSGGNYELSALSSTTRKMFVDFGDPINGTIPPTMLPGGASSGYVPGRFVSKFGGIDSMAGVGSTLTGGLPFVFTGADGVGYQVRMNSANEPGTTDATVTCTHVSSTGTCDGWSAVPAGGGKAIGRLVKVQNIRGTTVLTYYGDFYMTFNLQFTKP